MEDVGRLGGGGVIIEHVGLGVDKDLGILS